MRALLAIGLVTIVAAAPPALRPTIVRVDVIASDTHGRIIENLTPGDFDLAEDGVPQIIESVRFVNAAGKAAGQSRGKDVAGQSRDEDNDVAPVRSEFDEQAEAAREGTRLFALLIDEYHISPGAPAARARAALARFVDRNLGPRDLVAVVKPLDSLLTIRATRDRDLIQHAIETLEGCKGEYAPRTAFEKNYIAGAPARIEQVRAQVTTSALNALVLHLGSLNDGRKTVLFVSEGLTQPPRRRGLEGLPSLDTVVRSANRYNVSIYAVDSRDGGAADAASADAAALRQLADGTDGRTIVAEDEAANLDSAMRRIADDASRYYLLTYRSVHADDGKFRDVKVTVKRAGVSVRARKGYWALWPDEALAAEMIARVNEPAAVPPPPQGFALPWRRSPLVRPWFGIARGDHGNTRVTFVWEPAARVPGDRARGSPPARIVLTALSPDGTQLFDGLVSGRAVFDAPPGRVRVRMAIEDASGRVVDTDVREISVRDLKGPVALGTAEFLRARTARELREVDADPQAAPVASREFSRAETLIVRVPAYASEGVPRVTARLMNRLGQPMRDLDVTPAAAGAQFQIEVPLASLAPGEYFFELSASSPAGEAKELIGFRVTN